MATTRFSFTARTWAQPVVSPFNRSTPIAYVNRRRGERTVLS